MLIKDLNRGGLVILGYGAPYTHGPGIMLLRTAPPFMGNPLWGPDGGGHGKN